MAAPTTETKTTSRASCACPEHRTPDRQRTTHVPMDLREPCAGCKGWVRQYCPRAKECA